VVFKNVSQKINVLSNKEIIFLHAQVFEITFSSGFKRKPSKLKGVVEAIWTFLNCASRINGEQ
jgi:hypothetical protein